MPAGRPLSITIRPPEIVSREMTYPRRDIWLLLGICLAARLGFCWINEGEYTDGVLQARQFIDPVGIWPPLYSALIYPLKVLVGELWAGRLISVVLGTLALLPLYRLTRRAFGTRAALYAGIFYIVAPVAMRWGIRLMSDATFALFFWWAAERMYFASDERTEKLARRGYGVACLMSVLALLTRYQGVLLLPPLLGVAFIMRSRFGRWPIKHSLWLLGLLLVPAWVYLTREGFIHDEQFRDRAFRGPMPLWKVILLNGEAFFALAPYFLTYPVAIFTLFGAFWTRQRRGNYFGWMVVWFALSFLLLQSAFSSFQERYFLPLMGFFWVLAGAGCWAIHERWFRGGRRVRQMLFPYLLIGTFGFSAAFGVFSLVAQRQAFGDIARASRIAAQHAGPDTAIFTNEIYREKPVLIAAKKVIFFAQRDAQFLHESYVPTARHQQLPDGSWRPRRPSRFFEPGTLIVLSDIYGGEGYYEYLRHFYVLSIVDEPQQAVITPLLPDIMSTPFTAQNPMAWLFRYEHQHFTTTVYRVDAVR